MIPHQIDDIPRNRYNLKIMQLKRTITNKKNSLEDQKCL